MTKSSSRQHSPQIGGGGAYACAYIVRPPFLTVGLQGVWVKSTDK